MATISLTDGFNTMSTIVSTISIDSTLHMPSMDKLASTYGIETLYMAVRGRDSDGKQCSQNMWSAKSQ